MDAKELNQILKDIGLGFVKMSKGCYSHGNVTYKSYDGKTVKGIAAGSYGPMTVTNAHLEHDQQTKDKIHEALYPHAFRYDRSKCEYVFRLGNKVRTIRFTLHDFPTYSHHADLDPGYMSKYWVPGITDEKQSMLMSVAEVDKEITENWRKYNNNPDLHPEDSIPLIEYITEALESSHYKNKMSGEDYSFIYNKYRGE